MGQIKIKEANRGKFTSWARDHGMSVQQAAAYILRNRDRFSSTLIKRANFARNAAKWAEGGFFAYDIPQEFKSGGLAAIRRKPGGSNVGKKTFANGQKRTGPYVGPSGGAPAGSYPVPDEKHARAALALAHNAPNPAGIRAAVHRKFPNIGKKAEGGEVVDEFKKGGIHINPKNKGKFNALKKRTGKSTAELTHSKNPLTRKRAIFAQNARKWHHADGGEVNKYGTGGFDWSSDNWMSALGSVGTSLASGLNKSQNYATPPVPEGSYADPDYMKDYNKYQSLENTLSSSIAQISPYASISDTAAGLFRSAVGEDSAVTSMLTNTIDPGPVFADAAADIMSGKFDWGTAANIFLPGLGGYLGSRERKKQETEQKANLRRDQLKTFDTTLTPQGSTKNPTFAFGGQFKGKTFGTKDGNSLVQDGEIILGTGGSVEEASNPNVSGVDNIPVDFASGTKIISRKYSAPLLKDVKKLNKAEKLKAGGVTGITSGSLDKNINRYYSRFLNAYNDQEARKVFSRGGEFQRKFQTGGPEDWLAQTGPYAGTRYVAPNEYEPAADYGSLNNWQNSNVTFSNPLDNPAIYEHPNSYAQTVKQSGLNNWGDTLNKGKNWLTGIGEMAPTLYNLGQGLFGKVDKMNYRDFANPYESKINSLMANRQYQIEAGLRGNESAYRTTAANLRNVGGGRGRLSSNLTAAQNAKMFADMALRDQQNNVNNQYAGEYAQMLYPLGRDTITTKMSIADQNRMAEATKRNYLSSGMTGIQQYLLTKQQMKNQVERDKLLASAIKGYSPYTNQWIPGLSPWEQNAWGR